LSLPVVQFSGQEALNQPYRFEIEVIGLAPAMPLQQLLHQAAFLSLGHATAFTAMHNVSCEHRGPHRVGYRLCWARPAIAGPTSLPTHF
jgi:type VI secretion system secreted protein VgrG